MFSGTSEGGGVCPKCGGFYAPGDVVAETKDGAIVHPECRPLTWWERVKKLVGGKR